MPYSRINAPTSYPSSKRWWPWEAAAAVLPGIAVYGVEVEASCPFTKGLAEDPKVNLIVRSIVSLAHSLQIRVNAEGVETEGQMRALQKHGCDELQGYLLGRPRPAEDLLHEHAAEAAPTRPEARESMFVGLPTMPAPL